MPEHISDSAKKRAFRILERRDMSRRELINKLVEKGESAEDAEKVARWLEDIGAIDDVKYAGMVARHYAAKGYGLAKIKSELFRRGISRELWDDALSDLPEPDERIDSLLRSRLRSDNPDRAEMKRAADALFRRGFSWDQINSAIERFKLNSEEY